MKIKGCPFCHIESKWSDLIQYKDKDGINFYVKCTGCEARGPIWGTCEYNTSESEAKIEAINLWNGAKSNVL